MINDNIIMMGGGAAAGYIVGDSLAPNSSYAKWLGLGIGVIGGAYVHGFTGDVIRKAFNTLWPFNPTAVGNDAGLSVLDEFEDTPAKLLLQVGGAIGGVAISQTLDFSDKLVAGILGAILGDIAGVAVYTIFKPFVDSIINGLNG